MTSMSVHPLVSAPADASRQTAATRSVMSPWSWMIVTCLLLGVSGGIRFWREWRFSALAVEKAVCPFPLAELPRSLGTWQASEDSEVQLDPEVARFAGASEHIVRSYLDDKTGEQATALILYGLGTMVYLHTPDVCYPSAGYRLYKGPIDRSITIPGRKAPVRYRWAIYTKQVGGISRYEETYHCFLHDGTWLPDVADRWKKFRYHPGLFKIQISHPVSSLSENGEGPGESLLVEFVRQIDNRLSAAAPGNDAPSAKATMSTSP
jgi:hypothetical protein